MEWRDLERRIRTIASARWNRNAVTMTIAGIKCDCVLQIEVDQYVIVEVTRENDLNKVRNDIIKLQTVRNSLKVEDIYCKCYFVMLDQPTDSMRNSGKDQKITVMSAEEFENEYFEYSNYLFQRKQRQFGSLVNAETGMPEENKYIKVSYRNIKDGNEFSIDDIVKSLKRGKRIVLKGDFGLGKSRCVKQIFDCLTQKPIENPYTIAINLRDHWGAKRGEEILSRHFVDMGMDASKFIQAFQNPNIVYLLDGFDEIGTQSWSSDIQKMQHIREMSVCALKDMLCKVKGGVLITGRDYYFNSDTEMLNCFGLNENNVIILECHSEFTDEELLDFISENLPELSKNKGMENLPPWFPKRPLIIQILSRYAGEIFSVDYALDDICGFWYVFLMKICEREARIYPALNPDIIRKVLIYLADMTRNCADNVGPITQKDLSDAFVAVAGVNPNDETAIMLQRLPSLGRISADSPDRQFLDSFILDGLRTESIIQQSKSWNPEIFQTEWKNPLTSVGLSILAQYIGRDCKRRESMILLARKASENKNKILAADIVAALCMQDTEIIDFTDICIDGAAFSFLSFEGKEIHKLSISNSIIEQFDLTNSKIGNDVRIENCIINTIFGISSRNSIPPQFSNCDVALFEMLSTTTLIKKARLTESQKYFVDMIRKLFFQPGAGRKESTLVRGMGVSSNKKLVESILSVMMDDKLITRIPGDEGYVYKPVRNQSGRVEKILTDLTLSKDPLWIKISGM